MTYTVTVKADADRVAANADNTVLNFVVPGTTPPVDPPEVCDPATQLCTTHPVQVPGFTVAKTADPVVGYQCCCWSDDHVHGDRCEHG